MNSIASNRERAQSAPIAIAFLLAITIMGTISVVALGATALDGSEQQAHVDQTEHGMTQFDSRAAEVALSQTAVQSVDFSPDEGTFTVEPSSGTITVTHVNYDDGVTDDGDDIDNGDVTGDDDEAIYKGTLGAMVYERGDTKLAYQGGGVWRIDGKGNAQMISPPEFHYRSGTLTLPVIRTDGSGAASGDVTATIKGDSDTDQTFPQAGVGYNGGKSPATGSDVYLNPLSEGTVHITIQSEYYQAWAEYFRARTDGTVTVDDANEKVTLVFGTVGATGSFDLPSDQSNGGGGKEVRGMAPGHSLTDFDFSIVGKDDQNSRFKNLRWSMYVEKGNQHFEIALGGSGNTNCGDSVKPVIYYSPDGGNTYQAWEATNGWTVSCINTDSDANTEAKLSLEFTGDPKAFEYTSISGSQVTHFKSEVGSASFDSGASDDLHADASHSAEGVTAGDTKTSDWLVAHYYSQLGPDFKVSVDDQQGGNGAGVNENDPGSAGFIDYSGGGRVVTYLHITENDIEVRLE